MRIKPIAEMEAVDRKLDVKRKTTFQKEDVTRKAVQIMHEIHRLKNDEVNHVETDRDFPDSSGVLC